MPAALSLESQVDRLRIKVGCDSREHFIAVGRSLGAQISPATYSRVMNNDPRAFDRKVWEKLLEVVRRMQELQDSVGGVPVDWGKTDRVVNALVTRQLSNVANELGLAQRGELQQMADRAANQTR